MFDKKKWDEEMWSLDWIMAQYILSKLLYFKNWTERYGYPGEFYVFDDDMRTVGDLTYEWEEILDDMIWAFMYIVDDRSWVKQKSWRNLANTYDARVERGLRLFGQYYQALWV